MVPFLDVVVAEKRFGPRVVLADTRLQVAPGELVTLVGASGCGKSTLLRIVAGLDRAFRGSRRLEGKPLEGLDARIGFIFQEPRLFPWLTVAENVGFPDGLVGEAATRDPTVIELLDQVGLDGLAGAYPKHLSGGQAQRVALARGLYSRPRLLLLDEPFSAVDAFTRMHLQDLLLDVVAARRITVVMVTHDIDEAVYLSHRVHVLDARAHDILEEVTIDQPPRRDRADPRLASIRRQVLDALAFVQPA